MFGASITENAIADFLGLENQGWRKIEGTAVACNFKHQLYFERSVQTGIRNGSAYMVTMAMDATTIASIVVFKSANGADAYTVKIASDGAYPCSLCDWG